jgi:4'-phosphopantetheinyl transferase
MVNLVTAEKLGDEIHVWQLELDRSVEEIAHWESILSRDEKARADRFHFRNDRNRFVAARGFLRDLLGGYLQKPPASLEFSYGNHGKPALAEPSASSGLSFNLSHSAGLAVYAIARNRNLGIDVEHIRPESAGENIATRYFSAREVEELRSLPTQERVQAFFDCWTRKEAYLKATGMGLQIPLDRFAVSLSPGQPAQFLEGVEPRWHLAACNTVEGYAAAIAYDGGLAYISCFFADARQQMRPALRLPENKS